MTAPRLTGDAARAVAHRGSHLQIIAAAGSGKTEVVSQRIASLIAEEVSPQGIVAFTFTERAAAELKHRVAQRTEQRVGRDALDRLAGLFVGTIHSYCFRLLQAYVPRYETYDVLDDHQLTAFLHREANRLELRQLDDRNRLFSSIQRFLAGIDVLENELLDAATIEEPFRSIAMAYYDALERYRLLSFGQMVVRAVRELERAEVQSVVTSGLRHLIVDEYQDVNPSQERLIQLLAPAVELCVVGDDDQAIYQWRGSDVSNIVTFAERYPTVATFEIVTNRRSRPTIIETANRFAHSIVNRLPKTMAPHRSAASEPEVVTWTAENEQREAGRIASLIRNLRDFGVPYRDIAVLVRGRVSYPALLDQFATFDIPVQPGSRTGLFDQPEADLFGRTFAWISDVEWRAAYQRGQTVDLEPLLTDYASAFDLNGAGINRLRRFLVAWKAAVPTKTRTADLVGEFYELLDELAVRHWDLSDPLAVNRMGTLARFTALLADYESVRRRARPDAAVAGEQVGGEDRGEWYYRNLAIHMINYAQGKYEGFDGEDDLVLDAVDLTTIHRAKGLEWPAVFVPSMTARRFPSSRTGRPQDWVVPRDRFAANRYEGSDADERRLFYVALTRARDWVSVSCHERTNTQSAAPSSYFAELAAQRTDPAAITFPDIEPGGSADGDLELTYSELSTFLECRAAYRLRTRFKFQPRLAIELGYGKAVHHVLRTIADRTRERGEVPTIAEVDSILDSSFFLPTANKPAHRQLKGAARRLVVEYATTHPDDLHRVWETERPFELRLDGVTVTGRADVILDLEGDVPNALAILDYKTSTRTGAEHGLQLQVYADAGVREGLDVQGAYVHDLKAGSRTAIDVTPASLAKAEQVVAQAAERLRARDFEPSPGPKCRRCEVRTVCASAVR